MTKSRCLALAVYIFLYEIIAAAGLTVEGRSWTTHKDTGATNSGPKEIRNIISPRMDFDEWTPLGRGDPLKNDPTFDYLPPVLDKVHYWKPPPPPPPPAPTNRAVFSSTAASVPVNYNRRFFLTDFSKKEPAAAMPYVQYVHKRPQMVQMSSMMGYHYPMPKTPLPMLTPPPYQRPTAAAATTTVEPMDISSSYLQETGGSAAESKQPPTVRAPPPMSSVRPILSHSVIKVLLENEVDRTTVTTGRTTSTWSTTMATPATITSAGTTTTTTTTATTTTGSSSTQPPATTDPLFAHYKQSAATITGRPMYLIIQGHSKVKTYGLLSKSEDLSVAAQSASSVQEHNHIGTNPAADEQSRRKRDGGMRTKSVDVAPSPPPEHLAKL